MSISNWPVKCRHIPNISYSCSVQFSHSVVSDFLWSHGMQHSRFPCPLPTPGVYTNSCPISRWCLPTSYPLSFPSPLLSNFTSIRDFSNESVLCIMWQKYWRFNFNISLSNAHQGLISFRVDWLYLFEVQGNFKRILHITVYKHQFFYSQLSL